MKLYLATGATPNYLRNISPYLKTVDTNSNFDKNILVCVGSNKEIINNSKNIDILYLKYEQIESLGDIGCIQHGEFLNHTYFNSVNDEDIICFTDGDVLMQRPLTDKEINDFKNIKDGEVLLQVNSYKGESLYEEYKKLSPKISYQELSNKLGGISDNFHVYNGGVIIANKKTWSILKEKYIKYHKINDNAFANYARIQWLLCFVINKYLKPVLMPPSIHTHFHAGPVINSKFIDNKLYVNDQMCLFSHFAYPVKNFNQLNKRDYFEFQKQYVQHHLHKV